jgi:hypothetical protein
MIIAGRNIWIPIVWWPISGVRNDVGITTSAMPSPGIPVRITPIERKTNIPSPA